MYPEPESNWHTQLADDDDARIGLGSTGASRIKIKSNTRAYSLLTFMPMTPTQRRYNVLASNLLFAAFILTIPFNYFTKEGYFDKTLSHGAYVALVVLSATCQWVMVRGWRGAIAKN